MPPIFLLFSLVSLDTIFHCNYITLATFRCPRKTVMPTIRIEDDVFEGLKLLAEPFVDTPNTVIRRLLASTTTANGGAKPSSMTQDKQKDASPPVKTRGALTPQSIYELFLLHCLLQTAGTATKHDATEAVIAMMKSRGYISAADLVKVQTGETKAANTIAWARNALKDRGLISQHSPRGFWTLTDEGKTEASRIILPRK